MTSTLATSRTVGTGRARATTALRRVVGAMAGALRAWTHRREVMSLLDLDDRALQDIGLRRGDVIGALSVSLHDDPSVGLRRIALDRELRTLALEGAARIAEDRRSRKAA